MDLVNTIAHSSKMHDSPFFLAIFVPECVRNDPLELLLNIRVAAHWTRVFGYPEAPELQQVSTEKGRIKHQDNRYPLSNVRKRVFRGSVIVIYAVC